LNPAGDQPTLAIAFYYPAAINRGLGRSVKPYLHCLASHREIRRWRTLWDRLAPSLTASIERRRRRLQTNCAASNCNELCRARYAPEVAAAAELVAKSLADMKPVAEIDDG